MNSFHKFNAFLKSNGISCNSTSKYFKLENLLKLYFGKSWFFCSYVWYPFNIWYIRVFQILFFLVLVFPLLPNQYCSCLQCLAAQVSFQLNEFAFIIHRTSATVKIIGFGMSKALCMKTYNISYLLVCRLHCSRCTKTN